MDPRHACCFLVRFLSLWLIFVLVGCGRTVTPEELAVYGTRTYDGHGSVEVAHAVRVALRTMGYTIVDENGGRIKTAPKVLMVAAAGGRYSAVAVDSSMAWVIEVSLKGNAAVVHASMRPSQGGHPLDPTSINASFAETAYRDLYHEIEDNLDRAPKGDLRRGDIVRDITERK